MEKRIIGGTDLEVSVVCYGPMCLAQVNILSSVFFAGISGSGQADIAAMGSTMMPAMEKEGYPRAYAATVTAQSATLSPTLPPNIVMVVYGAVFGVPVAALFGAGITVGFSWHAPT